MPKYIANGYLIHNGNIVQTGGELELTKEKADRLGDKVTVIEEEVREETKVEEKPKKETKAKNETK